MKNQRENKKWLLGLLLCSLLMLVTGFYLEKPIEVQAGIQKDVYEEPTTSPTVIPTLVPTTKPTVEPTAKPTKKPVIVGKVTSVYVRKNSNSITVSWKAAKNAKKYQIERKVKGKYRVIATTSKRKHIDKKIKFETKYSYRIRAVSDKSYGTYSPSKGTILKLRKTSIKGSRKGKNKVSLKWYKVTGADGYVIYMSNYKDKGYKAVKYIKSGTKVQYTKSGLNERKQYYFKIRSYVNSSGKKYSKISNPIKIDKYIILKIKSKIKQLRKKYPIYKYWNHVGVSTRNKEISEIVTNTPCVHPYDNSISLTCNYYYCPDNIIGYQCYGFAWKLSDEIFGSNAKIRDHRSFAKAKAGDVIRYQGHSVIIIEKYRDYITVAEANFDRPCMIYWDRIIWKEELKGAKYSTRY